MPEKKLSELLIFIDVGKISDCNSMGTIRQTTKKDQQQKIGTAAEIKVSWMDGGEGKRARAHW